MPPSLRRGATIEPLTLAEQSLRDNASASPFERSLLSAFNTDVEGAHRTAMLEAQVAGDAEAERAALRNMADAQKRLELPSQGSLTWKDANTEGDFGNYLQNIAGSAAGSMIKPLIGGALGGVAGPIGAAAGAYGGSNSAIRNAETARYGQDAELSQLAPEEQLRLTRNSAALQAIPEAILPAYLGVGGRLPKSMAAASFPARVAGASVTEAGTEGLQSFISQKVDQTVLPDREVDWEEIKEGAIAGGIVGGGFGALGAQPAAPKETKSSEASPFEQTPEEQAAADLQPDAQAPEVLNAADPAAAIMDRDARKVARAATHAEILMADPNTPDYVKERVAGFGGDFTAPEAQLYVNTTLTAQRASEKMTAAVEGFAEATKNMAGKAMEAGTDFATQATQTAADLSGKAADAVGTAAAKTATVLDDAAMGASDRIIRKNLQDVDLATLQPLTQLLLTQLPGQDAAKAPDLARKLVAAGARLDLNADITPAVEQRLRVLDKAVSPEVIDLVSEISGNPALREGLAKIRKIPSATNDLVNAGGNSMLEKMLKQPLAPGPLERLGEMVDDLGLKLKGMSAHQKDQKLGQLAEVFGSKREAQVVVEYYGNLRRAAQEQEAARDANREESDAAMFRDEQVDGVEEGLEDGTYEDAGGTVDERTLTIKESAPGADYHFADPKALRPYRAFAGSKLSNGKTRSEARLAAANLKGTLADARVRPIKMSEYVEKTGRNPIAEVKRIAKDIEKRLKERSANKPELEGQLELMRVKYKEGGAKAVLDLYEVLEVSGQETNDTVATDEDISKFAGLLAKSKKETADDIRKTKVTFQRADGTKFSLSAESMWKTQGDKEGPGKGENSIARAKRLFADAVASVMARPDKPKLLTPLDAVVLDRSTGVVAQRKAWGIDRRAAAEKERMERVLAGRAGAPARKAMLRDRMNELEKLVEENGPYAEETQKFVDDMREALAKVDARVRKFSAAKEQAKADVEREVANDLRKTIEDMAALQYETDFEQKETTGFVEDDNKRSGQILHNKDNEERGADRYTEGTNATDVAEQKAAKAKPTLAEMKTRAARIRASLKGDKVQDRKRLEEALADLEADIAKLEAPRLRALRKKHIAELDSMYEGYPNAFVDSTGGPDMKALHRKEKLEKLIDQIDADLKALKKPSLVRLRDMYAEELDSMYEGYPNAFAFGGDTTLHKKEALEKAIDRIEGELEAPRTTKVSKRDLLQQYKDELDSLYEGSPNAFVGQFGPDMKALYRKEELEKLIDELENPTPAPKDRTTKKSFVGERADPAMARFADQALKAGVPADEVWQQMGWFRGPDGKMRKEIRSPALKARLRDRFGRQLPTTNVPIKLWDLLDGLPEFAAYKDTLLKDVVISPNDSMATAMGVAGSYNPGTQELNMSITGVMLNAAEAHVGTEEFRKRLQAASDTDELLTDMGDLLDLFYKFDLSGVSLIGKTAGMTHPLVVEQYISTILHELQHALQHVDGFENGGNPTTAVIAKYGDVDEYLQAVRDEDFETLEAIQRQAFAAMQADLKSKAGPDADPDAYAHDLYENIIGEVEANDVQKRMNLTDEEARGLKPALTDAKREFLRSIAVAEAMSMVRGVNASAMNPGAKTGTTSAADQKKLEAELKRIRGDKVKLAFEDFLVIEGSGDFSMNKDKTDRLIRIAHTAANQMSTLWHESLHDFFAMLDEDNAGRSIKRDLVQAASAPHVRKRMQELLKDHPAALEQIEQSAEERVAYMYQFWAEGELQLGPTGTTIFERLQTFFRELLNVIGLTDTEGRAKDLLEVLHSGKFAEPSTVAEVLADMPSDRLRNKMERLAPVVTETLTKLAETAPDRLRDYQNETLNTLTDDFEKFIQRRFQKSGVWQGKLAGVLKGTTAAERRAALENMQAMKPASTPLETKLADYFKEIHAYMLDAGVMTFDDATKQWKPLRQVKDYFPRAFDRSAITKDRAGFEALLVKHGSMTPASAKATTDTLIRGTGQIDLAENEHALGFTPFAAAVQDRKLTFINKNNAAEFAKYQSKDMADILMGYTKQAVHRAEYVRMFDNEGRVVNTRLDESGIKGKDRKDVAKIVQALEGTLGSNSMSTAMKEVQSGVLTLQNTVLLPLAIFSQMIDPIVLAARTGDIRDAGKAYITGIKRLVGKKVPGEELAEILGIVAQDSVLEAMGNAYGTTHMSANMRKINQTFFKYNGMQGWNNSMRIAATAAGERYIMANKSDATLLAELGLKPSDIGATLDFDNPKIAEAMYQFVDQAVLRPSAANRPVWMSDPRFLLVAHLKQFTFAMHNVVLKRARREMDAGNLKPWGILMLAMPTILAADMAKFALLGGGPPGWGFMEYMTHAVERSGLLGLGDFSAQAMHGVERGGVPGERLLGPTFEHAMELFRWVGDHPQVDTGDVIDRTVPLVRYI